MSNQETKTKDLNQKTLAKVQEAFKLFFFPRIPMYRISWLLPFVNILINSSRNILVEVSKIGCILLVRRIEI